MGGLQVRRVPLVTALGRIGTVDPLGFEHGTSRIRTWDLSDSNMEPLGFKLGTSVIRTEDL